MTTEKLHIETAIEEMKQLQNEGDIEVAHSRADDILCEILRMNGFNELVNEWEKVSKRYALGGYAV